MDIGLLASRTRQLMPWDVPSGRRRPLHRLEQKLASKYADAGQTSAPIQDTRAGNDSALASSDVKRHQPGEVSMPVLL